MSTVILSVPESLADFCEELWEKSKAVDYEAVGVGLGASEYRFRSHSNAQVAWDLVKQEITEIGAQNIVEYED
jgi:hypothetical protein